MTFDDSDKMHKKGEKVPLKIESFVKPRSGQEACDRIGGENTAEKPSKKTQKLISVGRPETSFRAHRRPLCAQSREMPEMSLFDLK